MPLVRSIHALFRHWERLARLVRPRRLGERARRTRLLGRQGEALAADFLRSCGWRVLGRNVRLAMGEADIVALAPDGETRVVVEVKTRRRAVGQSERSATALPEESVTSRKRRTLMTIARRLARANGWSMVRVDVVAVEWGPQGVTLRHHPGPASRFSRGSC